MINYYLLTKPGIILGNLFTFAAGFLLASRGQMQYQLFLATLAGLAFVIASACVFNNYIDRTIDRKMKRTQNRALASGVVSEWKAILFGIALGIMGAGVLLFFTNVLTLSLASLGFFIYVALYSMLKAKTTFATAIGSIAGAIPPVVGYCAVSNRLDLGALLMFAVMILWQMPHFYAIALFNLDDYTAADLPVLPVKKGIVKTKVHMMVYIAVFIIATALLSAFGFTGYLFLAVTASAALLWLALSIKGFTSTDDVHWGRRMFGVSLITIGVFCLMIPIDCV